VFVRRRTATFWGGWLIAAVAFASAAITAQQRPRTVWDGVYTDAQAARGKEVYARACTYCHLDDLSGSLEDNAPALVDSAFADRWRGQTVGDMARMVSGQMPKRSPGSLKPQEYLDVITYIFKANGIPAGSAELPLDIQKLEQLLIVDKPSQP
jgi:S-disulfanyl-L-cysteine oxidoreductase SoxD